MTRARTFHTIADALGCDSELVGAVATELKLKDRDSIESAVRQRLSGANATDGIKDAAQRAEGSPEPEATPVEAPAPKKPAKPGLTLSQRRALLRLLDGGDAGFTPATPFKALPYVYATEVGYATETLAEGVAPTYHLTDDGRVRAESINPAYRDWSAGETVVNDESRPTAGTHRAKRAAERAADEAAAAVEADAPQVEDVEPANAPELVTA